MHCGKPGADLPVEASKYKGTESKARVVLWFHSACHQRFEMACEAYEREQRLAWMRYERLVLESGSRWIADAPTLPGAYWVRHHEAPSEVSILEVALHAGELKVLRDEAHGWEPLSDYWLSGSEWQAIRPWEE